VFFQPDVLGRRRTFKTNIAEKEDKHLPHFFSYEITCAGQLPMYLK
jgi:hypothetical protein